MLFPVFAVVTRADVIDDATAEGAEPAMGSRHKAGNDFGEGVPRPVPTH
jgi:hypothetical protein